MTFDVGSSCSPYPRPPGERRTLRSASTILLVKVLVLGYSGRVRTVERWRVSVGMYTLARYGGGQLVMSGHGGEAEVWRPSYPRVSRSRSRPRRARHERTSSARCRCSKTPIGLRSRPTTSMHGAPRGTSRRFTLASQNDSSRRTGTGGTAGGSTRLVPRTRRSCGCDNVRVSAGPASTWPDPSQLSLNAGSAAPPERQKAGGLPPASATDPRLGCMSMARVPQNLRPITCGARPPRAWRKSHSATIANIVQPAVGDGAAGTMSRCARALRTTRSVVGTRVTGVLIPRSSR